MYEGRELIYEDISTKKELSALKFKHKLLDSLLYVRFSTLGKPRMHYGNSCVELLKAKYQEKESVQVSESFTFYQ